MASATSKSVLVAACVVFAATSIGVGVTNHRLREENEALNASLQTQMASLRSESQATAKNLEAVRAQCAIRQAELEKAQEALKAALAGKKAAEDKCATLEAKAVAPTPKVTEAPKKPKKKNAMAQMMAMSRKMMDTPAMKEQMRQGTKSQVETIYADLFKEWGLVGDARDKVAEALANRMMGQVGVYMSVFDEEVKEDEIIRQQQEAAAKASADLAGVLSGAQWARLEAYDKELPARERVQKVDQELAPLHLQPSQQEQVRAIILEEQPAAPQIEMHFGSNGGGTSMLGEQLTPEMIRKARQEMAGDGTIENMSQTLKDMAASRERIFTRVQPLLTPDQFEMFKKQEEAKAQAMEMSSKMIQSMNGSEAAP